MDTADNVGALPAHDRESLRVTHVLDPPGLCVKGELSMAPMEVQAQNGRCER
jgi:hypothetical protein